MQANKILMKKIVNWTVTAALLLIIAALVIIFFAPDYDLYLVRSESMRPAINMGDLIITGPVGGPINGEVKAGKIITFSHDKELVTHRVQSIHQASLVTKGDAVEDPDPWAVTLADVAGVYLFKIPYVGFVTSFVQTKFGWFLTIIIPATALVFWLVRDILKEAFSNA